MTRSTCVVLAIVALSSFASAQADIIHLCQLACTQKRTKDVFVADPDNCQAYFHCQLTDEGSYVSQRFFCGANQHWRQDILQCVPGPCDDPCMTREFSSVNYYVIPGGNCRIFYQCSNGISVPQCCPAGTSFDAVDAAACVLDENCTRECSLLPNPTPPSPPAFSNGTVCIDQYNSTLAPDLNNATKFFQWDEAEWIPRTCAAGTLFSALEFCGCHDFLSDVPIGDNTFQQCFLYLPFDSNTFSDNSIYRNAIDQSCVAVDGSDKKYGDGSAYFNGSCHIEIPAFQNKDFGHSLSICFWQQCADQQCAAGGGVYSQISSNPLTPNAGTRVFVEPGQSPISNWELTNPTDSATLYSTSATIPKGNEWNHFCYIKQEATMRIYVNGQLSTTSTLDSDIRLKMNQCVLTIGVDDLKGYFTGRLDELVVCETAFTDEIVQAVYQNNRIFLSDLRLLP